MFRSARGSPGRSGALRRVHGRYAQYFNTHSGRTGHLWQNRYFACPLGPAHLWRALAYVDSNPVRAHLVDCAGHYAWSSAAAHLTAADPAGLLDLAWWRVQGVAENWQDYLRSPESDGELESCTYAGRPLGDPQFVTQIGERLGRTWTRGRPKKKPDNVAVQSAVQASLFASG